MCGTNKGKWQRGLLKNRKEWKLNVEPSDFSEHLWSTKKLTSAEINFLNIVDYYQPGKTEQCWEIRCKMTTSELKANTLFRYKLFFGEVEGEKRYKNKNVGLTREKFIKLYGEENGNFKFEELRKKRKNPLALMVGKYGKIEGEKRYKAWCNNNAGNHSLERKIKLYGEEVGTQKYEEFIEKCRKRGAEMVKNGLVLHSSKSYSNLANKFFELLLAKLKENEYPIDNIITYAQNSYEYKLHLYYLDFCDTKSKKYIEFHGDRWHANPTLYEASSKVHPIDQELTSQMIWERDEKRANFIKELGYKRLVIWEYDFKHFKDATIDKALNFLKNDN